MQKYPLKEMILSFILNVFTLGAAGYLYRATSIEMTKSYCDKCFYTSFYDFCKLFKEAEPNFYVRRGFMSLFSNIGNDKDYLHADIMRLGNKGLILSTYGYLMAKRLIRKKVLELNGPVEIYDNSLTQ